MASTNALVAVKFQQMADALQLLEANRFKVIAFQRAARVLEDLTIDVSEIDPKDLTKLEGIGKGMADRITEFNEQGRIADHAELMEQVPEGLLELVNISGLGPKTAALLWKQAGITDLDSLRAKLDTDELKSLPGLGAKKVQNIKKNLAFVTSTARRTRIGKALPLALRFVEQLRRLKAVKEAAYAGSLRRGQETIGDLDLLVAAAGSPGSAEKIAEAFVKLEPEAEVLVQGPTKTSIRTDQGLQVDLRIVPSESFGAALMYFTGSKEHNIRMRERAIKHGMSLNEYALTRDGKPVAAKTEKEVFKALGLTWIPPELRLDRGELSLAERDDMPKLIELSDIKAELHAHTTASDGRWSIRELASAAAERGFHTVAVTDHSKGQAQANGLTHERLEQHIKDVRTVAAAMKDTINILAGSEVDILGDGKLDYPDSLLEELDIVVASPHASLAQDTATCTRRLLKAIANPYVTIIGHATGRMVNRREGLEPDMPRLFKAAAERGIAMEINANHHRLDLRDVHARGALEAGVKLSINTDAHGPADLGELIYGILTARRASATKQDVINCMPKPALMKWIRSSRG